MSFVKKLAVVGVAVGAAIYAPTAFAQAAGGGPGDMPSDAKTTPQSRGSASMDNGSMGNGSMEKGSMGGGSMKKGSMKSGSME